MRWEDIEKQFDVSVPHDVPVFPVNIVCELLDMHYHTFHEIMKQGLLEFEKARARKRKKAKKLFSHDDICRLKYIQHLLEDEGVNINGIRVILDMFEDI